MKNIKKKKGRGRKERIYNTTAKEMRNKRKFNVYEKKRDETKNEIKENPTK